MTLSRPIGCLKSHDSQLTKEYFSGFMGDSVKPSDVFLAFTVDQGGNVVNACTALGVPVVKCNCHRINSAVVWALGIAGPAATCKNALMGELMKKLAALVGVFSHSAVNNDMLKELQRLEADLHRIYELMRRNDTRCVLELRNHVPRTCQGRFFCCLLSCGVSLSSSRFRVLVNAELEANG
ncbi:unnamed protein product [Ectocarpus sp. 4 AP-2014]